MKTITVNSKITHKCKTMLRVIRDLVLDFILYFATADMRKYPIHATSPQGTRVHYTSLEEVSKKYFMINNLQQ